MVAAIDFTGSNGSPKFATSLHYLAPNKLNQYMQVLTGIYDIIANYDTDQKIPAFGFGASLNFPRMKQNTVNHCFPLTGEPNII
jgi:hypothetical protein